jgi:hypothetical protein
MSRHKNQTKGLAAMTRLLARSRGAALGSVPVAHPDATKRAIEAVLAKRPLKPPKRPDWATVELEDEAQPDGAVLVKDSQGNVVGVMSRETFDNLRGGR